MNPVPCDSTLNGNMDQTHKKSPTIQAGRRTKAELTYNNLVILPLKLEAHVEMKTAGDF